MPGSNFAAVWDEIARTAPDRTALAAEDRRVTWAELAERAHHLAWYFRHSASLAPGDRVAIALGNRPEYLEAFYAALSIRCVPVNVTPRATTDELRYVLDDSDAKVVIHEPESVKPMRTAAKRIPKRWRPQLLEVGDAVRAGPRDRDASGRIATAHARRQRPRLPLHRHADRRRARRPAVMWRNDDLYRGLVGQARRASSCRWRP